MRHDIQVLRGLAVALVVLSHAFTWLPSGSLGVDVFFVLSGFLMSGMIVGGLDRGDFTFRGFYVRRARRLLPASLTTVAATVALAPLFLPAAAWPGFAREIIGALTFTANHVAESQTGGLHQMQPLSHFWSLSLEEQFYFVFPLLLWLAPKRLRPWGVGLIAVESFALMLWFGIGYLLLHRAWELLAGSLAYFAKDARLPSDMKWGVLVLGAVGIAFSLIPLTVLATAFLLIGKDDWLRSPAIERIGDWSYSIYLIHWPLIAFATIALGGSLTPVVGCALIALTVALAALQYRFVEQPFRKANAPGYIKLIRRRISPNRKITKLPSGGT